MAEWDKSKHKPGDELAVLWVVQDERGRAMKAAIHHHPLGPEFRLYRDAELIRIQLFKSHEALLEHADEIKDLYRPRH